MSLAPVLLKLRFDTCVFVFFRFFVMYLINKDETEHTGQVNTSLSCNFGNKHYNCS